MNIRFAKIPAKALSANLWAIDWAVLAALGLHADKVGRAFPSMARIAALIGTKRNNIPRSLHRLETQGLLRRHRVRKPGGGWHVTHYELVFEPLDSVITHDDTGSPRQGVITCDDRVSSPAMTGVITHDALTDHLTDQGTDSYQGKDQGFVRQLENGHVFSAEDILVQRETRCSSDEPGSASTSPAKSNLREAQDPALDPLWPCRGYVTNEHGFKLCGKASLKGTDSCPVHNRVAA